ncbi:MAG TPA: hypothetical protein VFZ66_15670 [Herpetosiphonaceae bacterium]
MHEAHTEHPRPDQDQPGTQPMSPGDEVPPDTPGAGESICPDCGGSGQRNDQPCPTCGGTGVVTQGIGGA